MSMKYVMIYNDWPERTRRLSAADKGRLVDALMAYARGEDPEPLLQGNEQFLFDDLRLQYDRDREQYERKCQQRVIAAEARWNAAPCEKESGAVVPAEPREAETGASASPAAAHEGKAAPAPCKQRTVPSPPDVSRTETDAVDAVAYSRNADDAVACSRNADDAVAYSRNADDAVACSRNADDAVACSRNADDAVAYCRIQEEEKEKDKYKYKEKDKYTTTPSTIVPRPVKNEEEEWEYHSSLLDKLRNGTREGAIPSAETQGCGSDNIRAEETGIFANGIHDEEIDTVADTAAEKAEDAICGERTAEKAEDAARGENIAKPAYSASPSPSPAVPHWVKEEEKETNERKSEPFVMETKEARPAEAANHGRPPHPPLPPVFHDDLIASIKAIDTPRGENMTKPAYSASPSPSPAVPYWVKEEEKETNERKSEPFISGTEKARPEEAANHGRPPHPPLPPVFHDDLIASIKAMGRKTGEDTPCRIREEKEEKERKEAKKEPEEAKEENQDNCTGSDETAASLRVRRVKEEQEEYRSALYDKLRNGLRECAAPSAERQEREGDAARTERTAEDEHRREMIAMPADTSSPSAAMLLPEQEEQEGHRNALYDKLRNGLRECAVPSAERQEREGDAVKAEVFAEDVGHSAGEVQDGPVPDDRSEKKAEENRHGTVSAAAAPENNGYAVSAAVHVEKNAPEADQEGKTASAGAPRDYDAWLALSETALPDGSNQAGASSPRGSGPGENEASFASGQGSSAGSPARPTGGSGACSGAAPASALPKNFAELCRAANLPCEAEHQRMAEALAAQYSADWLADAMLLAGFERRTANWHYVTAVLRNAKQRGYVSLNLPNRDPAPAPDAAPADSRSVSPCVSAYGSLHPPKYNPARDYANQRDYTEEEINRAANRAWRLAMEEEEKENEEAKAREDG